LAANRRIGIIGIGNMGTALIVGMLKAGVVGKDDLCAMTSLHSAVTTYLRLMESDVFQTIKLLYLTVTSLLSQLSPDM